MAYERVSKATGHIQLYACNYGWEGLWWVLIRTNTLTTVRACNSQTLPCESGYARLGVQCTWLHMVLSHVVVPGSSDEVVGVRTEGYLADAIVRWLLNFEVLHGIVRSRGAEALRKHSLRRSKRSTFPGSTPLYCRVTSWLS